MTAISTTTTTSILPAYDIREISRASPIEPELIRNSLKNGSLPTALLYDERGLQLFERITFNPDYYLTGCEIDILERFADDIAHQIQGSTVIELGSGALRKTSLILKALENLAQPCDYYALDLDRRELDRSLRELTETLSLKHVRVHGLHADYNDIHAFLAERNDPVTILWMGSSVGNFSRESAAEFLRGIKNSLKPGDTFVIGADRRNDPELVHRAYNDPAGDTAAFELNGLIHANRILGQEVFRMDDWCYEGHVDVEGGFHEANYKALADVRISEDCQFDKGSRIRIERSYKFDHDDMLQLLDRAQLSPVKDYSCRLELYSLYIAQVPIGHLPANATTLQPLPSIAEWEELWKIWDCITLKMIPDNMLLSKPIDLRNPCIFYIGHIPTFLDIHLARVDGGKYINSAYTQIFERGIDPDVDDPTQCHAHSECPDTWPDLAELLQFRDQVRQRLRKVYASGRIEERRVGRAIFTGYEHEAMHAETLLYMLLQSNNTLPPPGVHNDNPMQHAEPLKSTSWIDMPATTFSVGMNDVEGSSTGTFFGWDNEKPARQVSVAPFSIASRPVTNAEYKKYLLSQPEKQQTVPCSWTADGKVKTVFGAVDLDRAGNWPVMASYDELEAYAHWAGARLPTYEELRLFIDSSASVSAGTTNTPFNNVHGACVNFSQWQPADLCDKESPQVYTGVWEWTSTPFHAHEGFVPSEIYPGYSADFFDSKHNIVLGGSWATIGRIAARKSFVNWYQRNYGYAWTGCRLVKK
ncbi:hypothetical protein PYCC9005_003651 [Savitreella phatthalungensis]